MTENFNVLAVAFLKAPLFITLIKLSTPLNSMLIGLSTREYTITTRNGSIKKAITPRKLGAKNRAEVRLACFSCLPLCAHVFFILLYLPFVLTILSIYQNRIFVTLSFYEYLYFFPLYLQKKHSSFPKRKNCAFIYNFTLLVVANNFAKFSL